MVNEIEKAHIHNNNNNKCRYNNNSTKNKPKIQNSLCPFIEIAAGSVFCSLLWEIFT